MNPNKGTPWTQDDMDVVTQMYRDGATYPEIGQRLGRGTGTVKAAVHRLLANGVIKEMRSASKPKLASKGRQDSAAIIGSALLRDAMLEYYRRHTWKDAA